MLLFDIDFCTERDFAQILKVESDSFTPWTSKLLYLELFGKEVPSSCIGAFSLNDDRVLLGYGIVNFDGKIPLILNIVVAKEHRRKGIGSQILLAICDMCNLHGFSELQLRVRIGNAAAVSLYQMFGFDEKEILENYYLNGETALVMHTSLPVILPGEDFSDEEDQ